MEEIWKNIKGFEGLYEASINGNIRNSKTKRILSQRKQSLTLVVSISKNGICHNFCVSRIIANTFLPNPNQFNFVGHIDGDFTNNNIKNLFWYQKKIYGVGIMDVPSGTSDKAWIYWKGMLWRCYDSSCKQRDTVYRGCTVCEEWLRFSNFKNWFYEESNYSEGYHLDKDILVQGNRLYSPETCCFVPQKLNKAVMLSRNKKSHLPIGVTYNKISHKYAAGNPLGKRRYFETANEAHEFYKKQKVLYVQKLAKEYYKENKISGKIYNSLLNFKID